MRRLSGGQHSSQSSIKHAITATSTDGVIFFSNYTYLLNVPKAIFFSWAETSTKADGVRNLFSNHVQTHFESLSYLVFVIQCHHFIIFTVFQEDSLSSSCYWVTSQLGHSVLELYVLIDHFISF